MSDREKESRGINLKELGWNRFFDEHFECFRRDGLAPARVARQDRLSYLAWAECGEFTAEVSGRLRHTARSTSELPAVGDWVAVKPRPESGRAIIHGVCPRTSAFVREAAGPHTEAQVSAANVDTAFLVSGLDGDFNLRRIERYLTLAYDSGAAPVVVLNKSDLCAEAAARVEKVGAIALGVPVHATSAAEDQGIEVIRGYLGAGKTAVLLGSSGVGKSTIVNRLLGEERLEVAPVRESDSHGRHTTTHRQLIRVPDGGAVIDTPGLRELRMWTDEDALSGTFADVEELAARCRFNDCTHSAEPGCAVVAAIASGGLEAGRLASYRKLKRELRHLARSQARKDRLADRRSRGPRRPRRPTAREEGAA